MIRLRACAGRGTSALVAQNFQYVDGRIVLSKRRANLGALHYIAKTQEHFAGNGHAFSASFFGVCGLGHAPHDLVGNGNT